MKRSLILSKSDAGDVFLSHVVAVSKMVSVGMCIDLKHPKNTDLTSDTQTSGSSRLPLTRVSTEMF